MNNRHRVRDEGRREKGREGGRERGWEGGREGGREEGRKGEKEGGREGGSKGEGLIKRGWEKGRERSTCIFAIITFSSPSPLPTPSTLTKHWATNPFPSLPPSLAVSFSCCFISFTFSFCRVRNICRISSHSVLRERGREGGREGGGGGGGGGRRVKEREEVREGEERRKKG